MGEEVIVKLSMHYLHVKFSIFYTYHLNYSKIYNVHFKTCKRILNVLTKSILQ